MNWGVFFGAFSLIMVIGIVGVVLSIITIWLSERDRWGWIITFWIGIFFAFAILVGVIGGMSV